MWICELCDKPVSDKGFRLFITYETQVFFPDNANPKSQTITQIRFCNKCLKKTGKNLEIKI